MLKMQIYSQLIEHAKSVQEMEHFIAQKVDSCWFLEHQPIYTNGTAQTCDEVTKTTRGGGSIYHGPGQCVIYFAANLEALNFMSVHDLISFLEELVFEIALKYSLKAHKRLDGPGVWIEDCGKIRKVAFIGLRVNKDKWVSHGIAINLNADLEKFSKIDVCGKQCVVGNLGIKKEDFLKEILLRFKQQFELEEEYL